MKRLIPIIISMVLLSSNHSNSQIVYPVTAKDNVVDTYFGIEVKEPYRWLEIYIIDQDQVFGRIYDVIGTKHTSPSHGSF